MRVETESAAAAAVAHAGRSLSVPATDTTQRRQFPTTGSFGYQQRVGMVRPASRAASRIVASSRAVIRRPSIVSVGMMVNLGPESRGDARPLARYGFTAMNQRLPLRGPRLTCQPA